MILLDFMYFKSNKGDIDNPISNFYLIDKVLYMSLIWQTVIHKKFWKKYFPTYLIRIGGKYSITVETEVNYKCYLLGLYGLIYQVKQ